MAEEKEKYHERLRFEIIKKYNIFKKQQSLPRKKKTKFLKMSYTRNLNQDSNNTLSIE